MNHSFPVNINTTKRKRSKDYLIHMPHASVLSAPPEFSPISRSFCCTMKISANIEVSNRSHASLAGNMRKRAVYSTLSIGKISRDGDFKIVYCNKSMVTPKTYNVRPIVLPNS